MMHNMYVCTDKEYGASHWVRVFNNRNHGMVQLLSIFAMTEDALSMSLMMVLFIVISLISKEILTYSFNISDSDELYSVTYNVFSITVVKLI